MTEIPEHLLKRAQAAREKAAAEAARRRRAAAPSAGRRAGDEPAADPRIPRTCSSAAAPPRRKAEGGDDAGDGRRGGGVAVADKVGRRRHAPRRRRWQVPDRRRARRSHAAPADRRQERLDPGGQGHAGRQGAHLAAPAGRRVRRRARVHGVHVRVLGLRQRAAAAARQHQPDAEPVEGAVVLPRPAGTAHDVPPDDRRRDHPRRRPDRADLRPVHRQEPVEQARGPQVRRPR